MLGGVNDLFYFRSSNWNYWDVRNKKILSFFKYKEAAAYWPPPYPNGVVLFEGLLVGHNGADEKSVVSARTDLGASAPVAFHSGCVLDIPAVISLLKPSSPGSFLETVDVGVEDHFGRIFTRRTGGAIRMDEVHIQPSVSLT